MKQAYTINEAIREIGIGRTKLYQEIAAGKIAPRKIGKKTIILAADLKRVASISPHSPQP